MGHTYTNPPDQKELEGGRNFLKKVEYYVNNILREECAMIPIGREDLLRALKKFKGLAKQDILASDLTSCPEYWRAHAEARRSEYIKLIDLMEKTDIEEACAYAFSAYKSIQKAADGDQVFAEMKGREQALEMFFRVIGIEPSHLRSARENYDEFNAFYQSESRFNYEAYQLS